MGVIIPDSSPSDNPLIPILINRHWLPILLGLCVDNLLDRDYWQGSESEIDAVIDDSDQLIYLLSAPSSEVSLLGLIGASWFLEEASALFEVYDSAMLLGSFNPASPDTLIPLLFGGAGGNTTWGITFASVGLIGDSVDRWQAQSFTVTPGLLTQFKFRLHTNDGSPTGNIVWELRNDSSGNPGSTIYLSGSHSPTVNAMNTINITETIYLAGSTTYWLVLRCAAAQAVGSAYRVQRSNTSDYAGGGIRSSDNDGSSWTSPGVNIDMIGEITTQLVSQRDKLAQSFQTDSSGDLDNAHIWIRKFGSPSGNLTLKLYSDASGEPGSLLATSDTIALSGVGSSFAMKNFTFSSPYSLTANNLYWIVLESTHTTSTSNWVEWQAQSIT